MNRRFTLPGQGTHPQPEWAVWLTALIALAVGLAITGFATGQTTTVTAGGMTISYPVDWIKSDQKDALISASDLSNSGIFAPHFAVVKVAQSDLLPSSSGGVVDAATAWSIRQSSSITAYRLLKISPVKVQGHDAAQVEYGYLMDPPQGAGSGGMPALMHAVDTIVASGDQYYILTFASPQEDYAASGGTRDRILASWRPF